MDLTTLIVKPATDAQWRRSQQNQYEHWADGLTFAQFLERDRRLLIEQVYASTHFERWVLVPRDNADTVDILSSCETFRRTACVKSSPAGTTELKTCFTVCAVFTEKAKRRVGYATRLMSLLHEQLAKEGICSVLYSYVGEFYSKARRLQGVDAGSSGWEIRSPFRVDWEVESSASALAVNAVTRLISDGDLARVCQRDCQLLVDEVAASSSTALALLPSAEQIRWIQLHSTICKDLLAPGETESMEVVGCQIGEGDDPDWAFALWAYKTSEQELAIVRLRCSSTAQLRALVESARVVAMKHGLTEISAWNVEGRLLEGTGWKSVRMTESLPALAWYGDGLAPESWLANEHWAWC